MRHLTSLSRFFKKGDLVTFRKAFVYYLDQLVLLYKELDKTRKEEDKGSFFWYNDSDFKFRMKDDYLVFTEENLKFVIKVDKTGSIFVAEYFPIMEEEYLDSLFDKLDGNNKKDSLLEVSSVLNRYSDDEYKYKFERRRPSLERIMSFDKEELAYNADILSLKVDTFKMIQKGFNQKFSKFAGKLDSLTEKEREEMDSLLDESMEFDVLHSKLIDLNSVCLNVYCAYEALSEELAKEKKPFMATKQDIHSIDYLLRKSNVEYNQLWKNNALAILCNIFLNIGTGYSLKNEIIVSNSIDDSVFLSYDDVILEEAPTSTFWMPESLIFKITKNSRSDYKEACALIYNRLKDGLISYRNSDFDLLENHLKKEEII